MATKKIHKKERQYKLTYWNKAGSKLTVTMGFDSENDAHKWVYKQDGKVLSVKFVGWK